MDIEITDDETDELIGDMIAVDRLREQPVTSEVTYAQGNQYCHERDLGKQSSSSYSGGRARAGAIIRFQRANDSKRRGRLVDTGGHHLIYPDLRRFFLSSVMNSSFFQHSEKPIRYDLSIIPFDIGPSFSAMDF